MVAKKKVVALILSPRRLGNCEILAKEICRHLPCEHELELIRLTEKKIKPCRGCYACLMGGSCPLEDDFPVVARALSDADALVIASPTYFLGANGVLKVFLDRCLQLFSGDFDLRGKPALNLVTAGLQSEAGATEMMLNSFSLIMGLDIKASEVFYGALPGEIFLDNPEQYARAGKLGEKLFAVEKREYAAWACPLCGSDVVQLQGGDRIQCMVCRNYGRLIREGESFRMEVELRPDNMFFTAEQAHQHGLWLKGMKDRFLGLKKKLGAICTAYADQGKWL
ncbi:MAG: flavodoxin family protein [Deltaproteobacteria bacterium]|nr:flavodoxin family protein [Deltaproteobacteria bacterium]